MAEDKRDADDWGEELEGTADAPTPGLNRELVRQALKLNPQLRDQMSTTDAMAKLEGASAQRPVAGPARAEQKRGGKVDVVSGLTGARESFEAEKARMQKTIAEMQKELQALVPQALERVLDVLGEADPNLNGVATQEMLKVEARFLGEIGFTPKKFIDRQLRRRAGKPP